MNFSTRSTRFSRRMGEQFQQEDEAPGMFASPWLWFGGITSLAVWCAFYWAVSQ